ncbi:flagellar protein FlgN [Paenibacillus doosanensis]|uniref:FlgN protein n=1 Tax=Paenibacillus konkukensis TaxID=2020716 RepID=A0ABY4RSM7_9BACL|nr:MULTISPECIES: flagellar protein FlgN [Paenibacillus]MCS7459954.1 flagellar protein FlgN [Paenibacillus doosanensis]UQZ84397.1 FlgN protein [Paenibacillus konkukensis]
MAFEALLQTMTALNDIHESLLELGERKKQVLILGDIESLMQIVSKENKLVKQIGELDQQRIDAIGQFMIEKGYKPNPKVTVSDLTKIIFNVEDKKLLLGQQKRLLGTINKLREMNKLNQQLIEHSLAFVDYSLDLIAGPPEDEYRYQHPQSQTYGSKRPGLFDTRA